MVNVARSRRVERETQSANVARSRQSGAWKARGYEAWARQIETSGARDARQIGMDKME